VAGMEKNLTNREVPIGFAMALAQNMNSMQYFSSLSPDKQRSVIGRTRGIKSKAEMQAFVDSISSIGI